MTKMIDIRKSILSVAAALLMIVSLIPGVAFAETPLATSETSLATFADSIERVIRTHSYKVYAATARAAGNEVEARAIEAEAASISEPVYDVQTQSIQAAPSDPAPAAAASAAATAPSSDTIRIGSSVIPFVQCYLASAAPDHTAGLWWGNSSTTDGGLGYFVGHNPGVFAPVVNLTIGDKVTVTDDTGAFRTYAVIDVFDVVNTTTLQQIQPRITGHGESIAMQACVQGGAFYRVVVAV